MKKEAKPLNRTLFRIFIIYPIILYVLYIFFLKDNHSCKSSEAWKKRRICQSKLLLFNNCLEALNINDNIFIMNNIELSYYSKMFLDGEVSSRYIFGSINIDKDRFTFLIYADKDKKFNDLTITFLKKFRKRTAKENLKYLKETPFPTKNKDYIMIFKNNINKNIREKEL